MWSPALEITDVCSFIKVLTLKAARHTQKDVAVKHGITIDQILKVIRSSSVLPRKKYRATSKAHSITGG